MKANPVLFFFHTAPYLIIVPILWVIYKYPLQFIGEANELFHLSSTKVLDTINDLPCCMSAAQRRSPRGGIRRLCFSLHALEVSVSLPSLLGEDACLS